MKQRTLVGQFLCESESCESDNCEKWKWKLRRKRDLGLTVECLSVLEPNVLSLACAERKILCPACTWANFGHGKFSWLWIRFVDWFDDYHCNKRKTLYPACTWFNLYQDNDNFSWGNVMLMMILDGLSGLMTMIIWKLIAFARFNSLPVHPSSK